MGKVVAYGGHQDTYTLSFHFCNWFSQRLKANGSDKKLVANAS